jgi:hypothetical protein
MIETKLTKALDNYICNQTHLKDYQILLSKLMYLMIQIRFNIAYSMSRLAQFMINSTHDHWIALKRVLRYLQKTKELKIHYTNVDHLIMKAREIKTREALAIKKYSDASWDKNSDNSRCTNDHTIFIIDDSVAWKSQKQQSVALFST